MYLCTSATISLASNFSQHSFRQEVSVQVSSVRHKYPLVTNDGTTAPRSNEVEHIMLMTEFQVAEHETVIKQTHRLW
jgi:hypothetical protein